MEIEEIIGEIVGKNRKVVLWKFGGKNREVGSCREVEVNEVWEKVFGFGD